MIELMIYVLLSRYNVSGRLADTERPACLCVPGSAEAFDEATCGRGTVPDSLVDSFDQMHSHSLKHDCRAYVTRPEQADDCGYVHKSLGRRWIEAGDMAATVGLSSVTNVLPNPPWVLKSQVSS